MPSLNRGRVIARFNEGKQCFEDMKIDSLGEPIVIDMVNGGGKSFLIQCLGQTVIPNSRWQKDWDFKAVFENSNKNDVVHCVTEWELDKGSDYKYLMAGFCASRPNNKSGDENDFNTGEFKKFSYICLYNEYNENDIFNIPLIEKNENGILKKLQLDALKKYLRDVKSNNFYVEIFDVVRDYQKRLAQYNITNAEWELIRAVNADEKYIATYLRQFSNSKDFILKFLIPKIEECNANRLDVDHISSDELAKNLLNIRELMRKLIKQKGQSKEYSKIIEFIELITQKLIDIKGKYKERDLISIEIKKSIIFLDRIIEKVKNEYNNGVKNLIEEEQNLKENKINADVLDIYILEKLKNADMKKNDVYRKEISCDKENLYNKERKLVMKKCENIYNSILQDKENGFKYKKSIDIIEYENKDLVAQKKYIGQKVKNYLINKIDGTKKVICEIKLEMNEKDIEINKQSNYIIKLKSENQTLDKDIERKISEKNDIQEELGEENFEVINKITKDSSTKEALENDKKCKVDEKIRLENENIEYEEINNQDKNTLKRLELKKQELDQKLELENIRLDKGLVLYSEIKEYTKKYGKDIKSLYEWIDKKLEEIKEEERKKSIDIINCEEFIDNLESNSLTLSKDTRAVYDILKLKYASSILGKDFLNDLTMDDKKYFLSINKLIPYGILLNKSEYRNFIKDEEILKKYFGGVIPIINQDELEKPILLSSGMQFTVKDISFFIDVEKNKLIKVEKEKELLILESTRIEIKAEIVKVKIEEKKINKFIDEFLNYENLEGISVNIARMKSEIKKYENEIEVYRKSISFKSSEIIKNRKNIKNIELEILNLDKMINAIRKYIKLENKCNNIIIEIDVSKEEKKYIANNLKKEEIKIISLKNEKQELEEANRDNQMGLINLTNESDKIKFINKNDEEIIEESEYIHLKGEFQGIIDKLLGSNSGLESFENMLKESLKRIDDNIENIKHNDIRIEDLYYIKLGFINNSSESIKKLQVEIKKEGIELKNKNENYKIHEIKLAELEGAYKEKISKLEKERCINYLERKKNINSCLEKVDLAEKHKEIKTTIKKNKTSIEKLKNNNSKLKLKLGERKEEKYKFDILNTKIDVDVNIDELRLEAVRDYKSIEEELEYIKSRISKNEKIYLEIVKKGYLLVEYMDGFKETLKILEILDNNIDGVNGMIVKLCGKDHSDEECLLNMIKLEQERVDQDINHLELQEQKFITLCIQKSENILRDIKKLSDLSVIEINGKRQEMIKVNLTKLDENIGKEKMKSYIENLINGTEKNNDIQRIKDLSKGLTVDKLLEQIIMPIKAKSLELYKLEDINNMKVNSWLSWDRAYGSKGQTNGMYISVLICLISYLRKLYTASTDESKKVIILDNPFSGTTSEIIWLPILKLLKANNVQLWAFGFEIKSQLSECFNVKYFLKKERTRNYEKIVASFKSEMNIDELGYDILTGKIIEPIQETLFEPVR